MTSMDGTNGRYTGFGFGPIQAGLFLLEAQRGGGFDSLTVAEVDRKRLAALRDSGGFFRVNVAHRDRVEVVEVGPVTALDPTDPADRSRLLEELANSDVIATALPSVAFYDRGGEAAVSRLLGEAATRTDAHPVVYCAENHNRAASLLAAAVGKELEEEGGSLQRAGAYYNFADTVIGKMSSVVSVESSGERTLKPFSEGTTEAFLVESFNAIQVSHSPPKGFPEFRYKPDLLPFEEAKLYGHNAVHALAGYLAQEMSLATIAECRRVAGFMQFLREAFDEECGRALCRRHAGKDVLFTEEGFRSYAEDLLERMTNQYLADPVERITRDPVRKLGWEDRLVGTVRVCLEQDVAPSRFSLGIAAALSSLQPPIVEQPEELRKLLREIWSEEAGFPSDSAWPEADAVLSWVEQGIVQLAEWRRDVIAGMVRAPSVT